MEESFELLEQRVQKAADLVKRLKDDNARLGAELEKARKRGAELEKRSGGSEKKGAAAAAEQQGRIEKLTEQVAALQEERDEIRRRIERLVSVLEALD
jgi:predicted  nucleic acid-binding Zn-ribbon protein